MEYKFRIWDTTLKKMYDLAKLKDYPLEYLLKGDTPYTKFMQYTGLKDKNGKEIYDGDILKKLGCWIIRVEYKDGTFWIRDLEQVRYINKITYVPISLFGIGNWTIMGNIHENPNLLTGVD